MKYFFWPYCIFDFTYLFMQLVSKNNVILDTNCFFSATGQGTLCQSKPQSQTVLLLRLCSHSNASSSLQWRLSRQQLDHRLTATVKHHEQITLTNNVDSSNKAYTVTFNCMDCNLRVKLKLKWSTNCIETKLKWYGMKKLYRNWNWNDYNYCIETYSNDWCWTLYKLKLKWF